jgi:hypothetical protein
MRIIEKLKKQEGLRMDSSTFAEATKQALEKYKVYPTLCALLLPDVLDCGVFLYSHGASFARCCYN